MIIFKYVGHGIFIYIIQSNDHINTRMSSENYMEQAIEKASKLIDLLKKQNQELKQQAASIQHTLSTQKRQSQIFKRQINHLKATSEHLKSQLDSKQSKIGEMKQQISALEKKLDDKTIKIQQLHEKVAELTQKSQTNSKNYEKQKIRNLSLNNQNEYLLRIINGHQQKQNQFENAHQLTQNKFQKEKQVLERTKQAFSRKLEEAKSENYALRDQIANHKYLINDLQSQYKIAIEKLDTLSNAQTQKRRSESVLQTIIQSNFKIKAQEGLFAKIEQIRGFLSYRLQHIQNLLKPIFKYFNEKSVIVVKDLETIASLTQRLNSYISDLIKMP